MKVFGYFCAFVMTVVVAVTIGGWVVSILWGWFMVPVFNIPALNIPQAIGIALIVNYLTMSMKESDSKNTLVYAIVAAVAKPGFALLFGWIVTLFL